MSTYSEGPQLPIVKIVEMIGESPHGWEDAMREVIAEAQKTLRDITRVAAKDFDVVLRQDHIELFRVRAEISFRLEGAPSPDYPMPSDTQRAL